MPALTDALTVKRVLSKLGICSRTEAEAAIRAGRVAVNGQVMRDPSRRVRLDRDRLTIDGNPVAVSAPRYLMLNKPRGLVSTRRDERGRPTVYEALGEAAGTPGLAPGRAARSGQRRALAVQQRSHLGCRRDCARKRSGEALPRPDRRLGGRDAAGDPASRRGLSGRVAAGRVGGAASSRRKEQLAGAGFDRGAQPPSAQAARGLRFRSAAPGARRHRPAALG